MFARHFIDSLDFAHKGQELHGEAPVQEMPRLQDVLASPEGQIRYSLRGLTGQQGEPLLELALEGELQLRCQRCMQAMPHAVKTVSRLMPVPESELQGLLAAGGELEEDETDRIPANPHLDVWELVEDEILLDLPLAPRHAPGACSGNGLQGVEDTSQAAEAHPFAVLRNLKK